MEVAPPFLIALLAHGVIGGSDVILNHELIARLPARQGAAQLPDGLVRVDYGWASWLLSAMSVVSLGWSVRDGVRALQLKRKTQG